VISVLDYRSVGGSMYLSDRCHASKLFVHRLLPMAVARSSCGGVAVCSMGVILVWMMSCLHTMARNIRRAKK